MKIAIACGGTGGHIFPGLATAEVLRARNHKVELWLSGKDIEKKALASWNGAVITIKTRGFPYRPDMGYVSALFSHCRAFLQCRRELRRDRPDVLLAFGGYGSVAPALAASSLAIPVILHEANVIPGRANRFLSRWAKVFALGFEETRSHIRHPNMVYTGIPLREMKTVSPSATCFNGRAGQSCPAAAGAVRPRLSDTRTPQADWNLLKPGVFTILAMGGSRGAHALNEVTTRTVTKLHANGKAAQIIHLTGTTDENETRELYRTSGLPHLVFAFLHDMDRAFVRASLAICRAGASTCAELARYGVPALLIPYPHAASNHQLANARALEKSGAADVIEEKDLTADWLADYICRLMADPAKLQRMRAAALKRAAPDAAAALADLAVSMRGPQYDKERT